MQKLDKGADQRCVLTYFTLFNVFTFTLSRVALSEIYSLKLHVDSFSAQARSCLTWSEPRKQIF